MAERRPQLSERYCSRSQRRVPRRGVPVAREGGGSGGRGGVRGVVTGTSNRYGLPVPVERHRGEPVQCTGISAPVKYWNMGPGGEGWGPAFLFVSLYKNLHPDPVSRNRGRHLRTPPTQPVGSAAGAAPAAHAAAAPASVRGSSLCGLRTRTRRGGDDGEARRVETRWRGAARGDNRAIVASPGSARMPSPTSPCNAPTLPFATVPVGAALETPAASNLRAPTRPMARAPVGNAKTHSTPSHYDGVEHKWWLPSPPPPPPPPPWASSRRPRHHIRRRLRRATRCVGAFAAAPAQHARALSAIVLRARAGPQLGNPSAAPP